MVKSMVKETGVEAEMKGWGTIILTVTTLAMVGVAGCGAGDSTGAVSAPVVRDSAGVMIVESIEPALGEGAVRISVEPELAIGVVDGDEAYQLNRVVGAVRLSDGRYVVANAGSSELRFYDSVGRHLGSVGGEGGGPGEFRYMRSLRRLGGDSLLVSDLDSRRISLFDGEGGFVTSYTLNDPAGLPDGVFDDGTLIGVASDQYFSSGGMKSGLGRIPFHLLHYTRFGEVLDTLGSLPGTERYMHLEMSDGAISSVEIMVPPFGRTTRVEVSGDRVYAGSADEYEIRVYGPEVGTDAVRRTRLERLIRLAGPVPQVTPALIESLKDQQLAEARDPEDRRRIERRFASLDFPEHLPAYAGFRVDAEDVLWVEEYRLPGEEGSRWQLFGSDGGWLTRVELPPRLRVQEIGADYLIGVWRDELDVEYLQVYGVERSGLAS